MITEPQKLSNRKMTPRQDTDRHDDNDNPSIPGISPPSIPGIILPTITGMIPPITVPTITAPESPPTEPGCKPKLRRPLSTQAPEFHPATLTPTTTTTTTFHIRPSLELMPPKRSPTVDSLLSALTPDEPRETKEEDTDELWAKLRCGSLRTEEVAEREKQKQERLAKRQNRCADYPGLAFGSAMFGSDTTMKFNIIKNELHNIMRSQLKRVDGEVNALSSRVKKLDMNLEESERLIRSATAALSECVTLQIEESKTRNQETESESNLSAFDQHILYLETQLKEAKIKASQSLQIMEDCDKAQENLLDRSANKVSTSFTAPTDHSLAQADNNFPLSSNNIATNSATILNNNMGAISNVNNNTTNNIFENEANNNNNNVSTDTRDISQVNNNCLKSFITEEDSANGNNMTLPV